MNQRSSHRWRPARGASADRSGPEVLLTPLALDRHAAVVVQGSPGEEEINLLALDPALVRLLDEQFDEDLDRSQEVEADRRRDRSLRRRALEGLTKPLRHKI
ncbi:MAG: hypothetical protein ACXWXS_10655 [Actinomycetota bacterium]